MKKPAVSKRKRAKAKRVQEKAYEASRLLREYSRGCCD